MKNIEKYEFGNIYRILNERLEKGGGDEGFSIFLVCFFYNL